MDRRSIRSRSGEHRRSAVLVVVVALGVSGCEPNPNFDPRADGSTSTSSTESGTDTDPPGSRLELCPPWPPTSSSPTIVTPDQAASLPDIVAGAVAGETIVLEPGHYFLERTLHFEAPGVTLRSSTGDPRDVVLDGQRLAGTLALIQASDTTLAELTLTRAVQHLVHVTGSATQAANRVVGYRLHLRDPGLSAFKINPSYENHPADDGMLACSTVELTDTARTELGVACNDASGVAGYGTFGWTIRDNTIEGFWCPTGFAGSAVRFLETSAHNLVERNVIRDCVSGIMLGLWESFDARRTYDTAPCGDAYFDHLGGTIRNNMIMAIGTGIAASEVGFDTGIGLWNVCDATIFHNTVASAIETFNAIEYRYARTQARVVNNLVTNEILDRDGARVSMGGNARVELNTFVDPFGGDLHLRPESSAIDGGVALGQEALQYDIDGDPRDPLPDIGADEYDPDEK